MFCKFPLFLVVLAGFVCISCKSQSVNKSIVYSFGSGINYNLEQADAVLKLDSKLKEVSGIAYHRTTDAIYAVNDEKGRLYALDKRNGNILASYDIGGAGDYEGLEIDENLIYVAESNGEVIVFDLIKKKKVEKLKNNLNQNNDIEAIGLGPGNDLLLLCKGKSLKGDRQEDVKHIYAIANTGDGEVRKYLGVDIQAGIKRLQENADENESWLSDIVMKDRISRFAPSGMATHPTVSYTHLTLPTTPYV